MVNASQLQAVAIPECPLPVPVPGNSRAEPVSDSPQSSTPLENLPLEVRQQLFSILEL